jgi:DJ-1 family protein
MKKVAVLVAEGFEEIECATPTDVLRRASCDVVLAGLTGMEIKGAHGLVFKMDTLISSLSGEFDMLVLPGGMPGAKHLGDSMEAKKLATDMYNDGKLVTAICAAPVMTLGAWGLLNGKKAACYPGMEGMFPENVSFSSERVVVDGNIITSCGPGTALEFSICLAAHIAGKDIATKLAADMLLGQQSRIYA